MQGIPLSLLNSQNVNNNNSVDLGSVKEANTQALLDLLDNLSVGDTLLGKIVSSDENSVTLLTNDNVLINAKAETMVSVDKGRTVLFEVTKSLGKDLNLRPLNINTNTERTATIALKEASIPLTPRSLEYTVRQMEYGNPIDRKSLSEGFREVALNEQVPVKYIADLQQLNIPRTEENIQQFKAYLNMENSVVDSFSEISEELSSVITDKLSLLFSKADDVLLNQASFKEIAESAFQDSFVNPSVPKTLSEGLDSLINNLFREMGLENKPETQDINLPSTNLNNEDAVQSSIIPAKDQTTAKSLFEQLLNNPGAEEPGDKNILINRNFSEGLKPVIKDFISKAFDLNFSIKQDSPDKKGDIKNLYSRLYDESHKLLSMIKDSLPKESPLTASVNNLSNNIDFMESLNHFIPYVQIPLSRDGATKNSELYVFKNGKSLSSKDSELTAFVHLDTDNLGPTDVFVKLNGDHVSTNFRLEKEEYLDFIESNIHYLNKRLSDKGYSFSCDVKLSDGASSPIEEMLNKTSPHLMVADISFDARV